MPEQNLGRFSRALQHALEERRTDQRAPLIADDIDWSIFGPIDMFPFLGPRSGKAAVLDVCQQVGAHITVHGCHSETTMLGQDAAAAMLRCTISTTASPRPMTLRLAQFIQFRDDVVVSLRAVIDTFDLVEQTLGRPIHLPRFA